jgi:hypothetical protein
MEIGQPKPSEKKSQESGLFTTRREVWVVLKGNDLRLKKREIGFLESFREIFKDKGVHFLEDRFRIKGLIKLHDSGIPDGVPYVFRKLLISQQYHWNRQIPNKIREDFIFKPLGPSLRL